MDSTGESLEAILTTNSSVSSLSTDVTKRINGFDKSSSVSKIVADADGHDVSEYRAMMNSREKRINGDE